MIRIVAFGKAAAAGAAGAVAWECAFRLATLAGISGFDIVRSLGTLAFPHGEWPLWWIVGLVAHIAVGVAWALIYAYFFWARFNWKPELQGLAFSLLPAFLAIGVMVQQLHFMHLEQPIAQLTLAQFVPRLSGAEVATLLAGHAIYGLTVGAIYTRPVGYPAASPPRLGCGPAPKNIARGNAAEKRQSATGFMFTTGIECSYPTTDHGRWRRDQLAEADHYSRWAEDFCWSRELGITHLRYGPPLHLVLTGAGRYSWDIIDQPMADLEAHGPEPIVDLCHFGLPTWLGDFQNADIARALAEYAGAFADRYPWVRFYTPVNEMYVCAHMSALDGRWNEQRSDEASFVNAVFNMAEASVAMTDAILARRPDAVFVNSESSEFYQPCCPDPEILERAAFENERRFLPLDLIFAHEVSDRILDYLREHGREDDYRRLLGREVPRRTILGIDYYEWNERLVTQSGEIRALGELFGWYVIANQYYERYGRTMMHTETNRSDASDAPRWLWRQWHNVQLLRGAGVPLVGFTWYSLTDQVDWATALRQPEGKIYPVGLFDLNRDPRKVGLSYKHLIAMYADAPGFRHCPALAEVLA